MRAASRKTGRPGNGLAGNSSSPIRIFLRTTPGLRKATTGQFATLHVAGCCRSTDFFEKTEPGEAYDVCVRNPIKVDKERFVHMPTEPGLGIDFDLNEIKRRTLTTL